MFLKTPDLSPEHPEMSRGITGSGWRYLLSEHPPEISVNGRLHYRYLPGKDPPKPENMCR